MMTVQASSQGRSFVNDSNEYATPYQGIECVDRNDARSKPGYSTGELKQSMYMSLKDNKEPENVYQPLQATFASPQSI